MRRSAAVVMSLAWVTTAAAGASDPASSASQTPSEYARKDLATQYLAVRAGIRRYFAHTIGADVASIFGDPAALAKFEEVLLKGARPGPDWNPQNPEWNQVAAMIHEDMPLIRNELAGRDPPALTEEVDEAVAASLAGHLTQDQLEQLIRYYSTAPGKQFAAIQTQMFETLIEASERRMRGEHPEREADAARAPSVAQIQPMLDLVDEYVRIHAGALDPGPGKDRSGIVAIPMTFAIYIRDKFPALLAEWNSASEADRRAILAWRQTPLSLAERDALGAAAADARRVRKPEAAFARLLVVFSKYHQKWAAQRNP